MVFMQNGFKREFLTRNGFPAAMAAIVFLATFPDLVFGSPGTTMACLKHATGPNVCSYCLNNVIYHLIITFFHTCQKFTKNKIDK